MTTIAYDRPVKDLIAGLDATGHVTHTQHRKTHVTVHHNGGRLSHEGVLSVWQVRPASAHFDVDAVGGVAQYVRVNEYAWATGDTEGNQVSISIEMCNETLSPEWRISDATFNETARLAGWLFARVIGYRPTRQFLVPHHDWSSTECAGPYMDRAFDRLVQLAQFNFDVFTGNIELEIPEGDDMYWAGVFTRDAAGNFAGWVDNKRYLCEGGLLTGGFTDQDVADMRSDPKNGPVKLIGMTPDQWNDLRIKGEEPRLAREATEKLLEEQRKTNELLRQLLARG